MSRRRVALALAALLATAAADPRNETAHVVAPGETLTTIAERAGVPASVIAEANGLRKPWAVRTGQRLAIPRQRSHTVRPGESGLSIARRYGVPYDQVAIANGLDAKGTVKPGQRLIIPAVVAARAPAPAGADSAPAEPFFRAPHDGKVLHGFAPGRHAGIDYAARPLDMVRAAASGTVSGISQHDPQFGRLVTIDHGGGWKTAYGHLARITVTMGDVVKAGERIGLAGRSGQAKDTRLHFELRRAGTPLDPAAKLAR